MHKQSTFNKYLNISFLLSLILLFFFFFVSFFSQPYGDDFGYAALVQEKGILGAQIYFYLTWQGRFFSNLFNFTALAIPSFYKFYYITPLFLLASLFLSFYFLIKTLAKKFIYKANGFLILSLASLITVIYLAILPLPEQSLYWIVGSYNYLLPVIFINFILTILFASKNVNFTNAFLVFFLGFAAGGCNEPAGLTILFLGLLLTISAKYYKNAILFGHSIFLMLGSFLSTLIVFLAPGNNTRLSIYDSGVIKNFWFSLNNGLQQTIIFFVKRFFYYSPILIPLFLLIICFFKYLLEKKLLKTSKIFNNLNISIIAFLYVIAIDFTNNFAIFWSAGEKMPFRALTIPIYLVLILLFILAYNFLQINKLQSLVKLVYKNTLTIFILFIVFFLYYHSKFILNFNKYYIFKAEKIARYNYIEKNKHKQKVFYFQKNTYLPWPIAFKENLVSSQKDPSFWRNQSVANYFKVKLIILEK